MVEYIVLGSNAAVMSKMFSRVRFFLIALEPGHIACTHVRGHWSNLLA